MTKLFVSELDQGPFLSQVHIPGSALFFPQFLGSLRVSFSVLMGFTPEFERKAWIWESQNSLSFSVIYKASGITSPSGLVHRLTHMNVSSSVLDSINISFFLVPLSHMEKCSVKQKAL